MVNEAWYVNRPFHLPLVGGEDFEFEFELREVVRVSLDGKVTDLQRGEPYDFTGWTQFYAEMRVDGVPNVSKVLSLVIDGPPENGELRLYGRGTQTWDLQSLGYHTGDVAIVGLNPAGQRKALAQGRWTLTSGAVSPRTPSVPDWTTLG